MGNVRAFLRDLAGGFAGLWRAQRRFLRERGARYDLVVAVGDVYGLWMALAARRPTIFVGTAKSVYVAPYGPVERRILRAAARVFVRDAATAAALREHGVSAEAPGNVIVDLAQSGSQEPFAWRQAPIRIAVLPGSRTDAYGNAARLGRIVARLDRADEIEVALSVADGLDEGKLLAAFAFPARPWHGPLGAIFAGATLAFGQAGTANEAAAASGLPVVALADPGRERWYRMRQRRLLGDALVVLSHEEKSAAAELDALLADASGLAALARSGRERMGPPGGAAAIARAVWAMAALRRARKPDER